MIRSSLAVVLLAAVGCSDATPPAVFRVGHQKWSPVALMRHRGTLDAKLARLGVAVEWSEFPSGPPLLEALNAGVIDFGHAGDCPPVFAQAAGVPFRYVAASTASPESSAILVRADSPLRTPADLKGRRVAFTKGSSAHTMTARALAAAGLTVGDIEPLYLPPADGRAALEGGAADAWAVWDPFLAAAEHAGGVRALARGTGLVGGREFYFASADALERRRECVLAVLDGLDEVKGWADPRPAEVAALFAGVTGLSAGALELAERRRNRYGTEPVTAAVVAEQQRIADDFHAAGLLPRPVRVADAVAELDWRR